MFKTNTNVIEDICAAVEKREQSVEENKKDLSFFEWFRDDEDEFLCGIFRRDIYQNPVQYFMAVDGYSDDDEDAEEKDPNLDD